MDSRAGRSPGSETVVVSDHALLCDDGARSASGFLRIPEAGARTFRPLVARVAPFFLLCCHDSGPRLFAAR